MCRLPHRRNHLLTFILFLVTINLAVFLPSMRGDFLWDDKYFISDNPNIQATGFLKNFLVSPFGGFSGLDENSTRLDRIMQFYRPLTSLSYWLDFRVWGLNPAAFHLTNILLHTANTIIMLFLLLSLGIPQLPSFAGALLFSVFPMHFENVAWISGRTDLLSFFFAAFSTWFLIQFLNRRKSSFLIFSSFLFFLSLLAKESTILLPFLFMVIFYKKEAKNKATFIFHLLPYFVALLGWLILRAIALGSVQIKYSGRTPFEIFAAIGFYTTKLLLPFNLSVTINPVPVFRSIPYLAIGVILIGLFIFCLFRVGDLKIDRPSMFLAGIAYFLLLLPPVAAILSAGTISLLAWRFMYLPSAILVAGIAWASFRFIKSKSVALILLTLIFLAYGYELYPKSALYGNEEAAFWQGFKKIEREDVLARFNIGVKGLAFDEKKSLSILNEILADRSQPLYDMLRLRIYEELGAYYTVTQKFDQAERYFGEVFKLRDSHSLHFYFNYAFFLGLSGRVSDGEKLVAEIYRQFPKNHFVLTRAAKFYLLIKDYPKAADFFSRDYNLFRTKQSLSAFQELQLLMKKTG